MAVIAGWGRSSNVWTITSHEMGAGTPAVHGRLASTSASENRESSRDHGQAPPAEPILGNAMSSRTLLLAGSAFVVLVAALVVGNLIVSCRGPLTPSKPAVRLGHEVGEVDARAGDWPSWRGRLGDGISRETGWTIEGRPDGSG